MAYKAYNLLWLLFWFTQVIFSQNLSVNTLQEIDFGKAVFPGIEKTIHFADSYAAHFEITGEANREIVILFQIPAALEDQGGNSLDIQFSSTDAGYNAISADPMNATVFNPNTATNATLNSEGKLYLWVGATVIPLHTQAGKTYQANLILDISYTN